ncbi:MAG: hypothetical protein CMJ18_19235 [Phycisphaeraceae bacterium]|nr:hypothetical protein [Phycisphaeraceae bacterium]
MHAAQIHRYCRTCGYPVDGLREFDCPECGRSFDPNDPSTYTTAARHRPAAWMLAAGIIGLLNLVVLSYGAWLVAVNRMDRESFVLTPTAGLVLAVSGALVAGRCRHLHRTYTRSRRAIRSSSAIVVASATSGLIYLAGAFSLIVRSW